LCIKRLYAARLPRQVTSSEEDDGRGTDEALDDLQCCIAVAYGGTFSYEECDAVPADERPASMAISGICEVLIKLSY
jgi:hypothetical protein